MANMIIEKAKSRRTGFAAVKVLLFCIIILATGSCKKEGDQGPQGTSGPAGNFFNTLQGGSIQGTISGTRSDGTPFTMNFNNQYYASPDYFSYDASNLVYNFSVERLGASDPINSGVCHLGFTLMSLSSTAATDIYFFGIFYQDLGNNQKFEFSVSASSFSSNLSLTNLSYNSSSRIVQGNFQVDVNALDNSSNYPASISGSFQSVVMKEYVSAVNPDKNPNHLTGER